MKSRKHLIALAMLSYAISVLSDEGSAAFSPEPGIDVRVKITQSSIFCEVSRSTKKTTEEFPIEAETTRHLVIDDLNFDGKNDFSVWYLDEGMGKYSIHRVFIYSPTRKTCVEQFPECGDEFINLRIDKNRKRLLSTYYQRNVPKICSTKPKHF